MAHSTYWLHKCHDSLYELRQNRYREQFCKGNEHPHDVCAIAHNVKEMKEMVEQFKLGTVDWNEHG